MFAVLVSCVYLTVREKDRERERGTTDTPSPLAFKQVLHKHPIPVPSFSLTRLAHRLAHDSLSLTHILTCN